MLRGNEIKKPEGKLGVLLVGLGAVSTTFLAGVEAIKKRIAKPIGSLTQMGRIRLGKRTEKRNPLIKDFVPLAKLEDMEFLTWDIFEHNAYQSALNAGVLEKNHLESVKEELEKIKPQKAVFIKGYVKKLDGKNVKQGKNKMELAEVLMQDILNFKREKNIDRFVMIWIASTEAYLEESTVHSNLKNFEEGLKNNSNDISPSMIYAYAALKMGIPFANGAPNLTVEIPALRELA